MQTEFAKQLGLEVPIFAFTHCRDVVVAVSKAGGIGVLGAVGYSPAQLKEELDWIDAHIGDHIYGVDTAIPEEHRKFTSKLLSDHGVPEWTEGEEEVTLSYSLPQAKLLVDEALIRPKCLMIVNGLGTPPAEIVEQVHASGRLIGALAGRLGHGINPRMQVWTSSSAKVTKVVGTPGKSRRWSCGRRWSRP